MTAQRFRCGDHVRHAPSGAAWVVAYADYETGDLAWSGWSEGIAKIADCALIKAATDEEHAHAVRSWLKGPHSDGDHRYNKIQRLYPVDCCGR